MIKSKRTYISPATLKKIEDFLKKQKKPIPRGDIGRILKVDYHSLNLALNMLKDKIDEIRKIEGGIIWKKE